jgi:polar amino acid transport system substrate-binding protein
LPAPNDRGFHVASYDNDTIILTAAVTGQADIVATSASLVNQMGAENPARGFEPKFVICNFDLAVGVKKGASQPAGEDQRSGSRST